MPQNNKSDIKNTYWSNFLKTGKIEDYLKYKMFERVEDTEISKIEEDIGAIDERKKEVLWYRDKGN